MDRHAIEKFFNDTCTAEQAERVVEWLATEEGQSYLSKKLEEEEELLKNEKVKPLLPDLNSEEIWNNIEGRVDSSKKHRRADHHHRFLSYWYVAAAVLLVCGLSVFLYGKYYTVDQAVKEQKPVHFITQAQERQELTLRDGTKIVLNSNSQLWISAMYGQPKREVTLEGEAYFEITHKEAKPFIIHTQGITIKDLGTAFNVRAIPGKKNVQVAVKRGKVSILRQKTSPAQGDSETKAIKLTGGHYAYVNLKTNSISVSEFEIKNYFSWISDRLSFDSATLANASDQLSHIYNVTFSYAADSLKTMRFSAKFERESLKRTLAVIALTLSIDYEIKNHHVIWKQKK